MVNTGPHNDEGERQRLLREVLAEMPDSQPPRGQAPKWGSSYNRNRAYYLAACWGHSFTPTCTSCDADVYDALMSHKPKRA